MEGIRLLLGGDVMTGRGIDQILARPGDPTLHEASVRSATGYVDLAERRNGPIPRVADPSYVWGDALPVLQAASVDVRIVNLETAITDRGDPWPGKGIHYRMHPDNVSVIEIAGIDCCVLANNHILDWSLAGLEQTLETLSGAGIHTAGAGSDAVGAACPAVLPGRSGGRVIVVALGTRSSGIPVSWAADEDRPGVALAGSLSPATVEAVSRSVQAVSRPGDLVVASLHWGPNWGYDLPESHIRFAHGLIDGAGVDVVHGHSSHHPVGIEIYRDRPILYGCGDLINDYEGIGGYEEYHPDLSVMYLVGFQPGSGRLRRMDLVPLRRRRFRLEHAPPDEVEWLSRTLTRAGRSFGTAVTPGGSLPLRVRW